MSVNPQPESDNVAKDMVGKIQIHEVRTIDDMSAVYCCLLWDQGLSECARPSSADKRYDVQQESGLDQRLTSAWKFLKE
eukprot:1136475-Pelagomonas_calceolata.AAC.1